MSRLLHRHHDAALRPPRDACTLHREQHAALVRWEAQRALAPAIDQAASREQNMDAERILEQYEREHAAIQQHLEPALVGFSARTAPVAVLAHRHDWIGTTERAGLVACGWEVLDAYGDAAVAAGLLVAHQPDLLLLTDRLLGGNGLALAARARELAPAARIVVQLDEDGRSSQALAAGAHVILSHRMASADVVDVVDGLRWERTLHTSR